MRDIIESIAIDRLASVIGAADGACGSFVELTAPNGTKAYYDPVGVISLAGTVKGESTKNAKTTVRTQLGAFYSADSLDAIKDKIAETCNAK